MQNYLADAESALRDTLGIMRFLNLKGTEERRVTIAELKKQMPPCPICGKKATITSLSFDGYFMGFDGGCPSYRINDGVHHIQRWTDPKAPSVTGITPEIVAERWTTYCEKMKAGDDMLYRLSPKQRRDMFKVV